MSIIEQAARRLEELRRSGIEVPGPAERFVANGPDSLPARLGRLENGRLAALDTPAAAPQKQASAPVRPEVRSKPVRIDLAQLAALGYITPDMPRSRIADEFRVVKRQLLAPLQDKPQASVARPNLIMVTSSMPGEGKTFVAINLAISIAMELDKTALLVDADVSRPSVLARLGLAVSPGLLDVLVDPPQQLPDVLLSTNIETLAILPAGKPRGRATELLASEDMGRLLDEMSSRYADRVLIFDAPPLLPSTESRVLASRMGQVVLVVEADRTAHHSVTQALATIEACPVVLPLLNKISRSEVGSYHGYYDPVQA